MTTPSRLLDSAVSQPLLRSVPILWFSKVHIPHVCRRSRLLMLHDLLLTRALVPQWPLAGSGTSGARLIRWSATRDIAENMNRLGYHLFDLFQTTMQIILKQEWILKYGMYIYTDN